MSKIKRGTWNKGNPAKTIKYSYNLPVLKGVKKKVKKAFNAKVQKALRTERRIVTESRRGYYENPDFPREHFDGPGLLRMRSKVSTYKHYASAALLFISWGGGNGYAAPPTDHTHTVVIDTRTGKRAKLSTFTKLPVSTLKDRVYEKANKKPGVILQSGKNIRSLSKFTVSKKGITFRFSRYELYGGALGNTSVTLSWSQLKEKAPVQSAASVAATMERPSEGPEVPGAQEQEQAFEPDPALEPEMPSAEPSPDPESPEAPADEDSLPADADADTARE
ncbi:MAG: hypothetical protein ACK5LO_07865 [Leucobacter sp.]